MCFYVTYIILCFYELKRNFCTFYSKDCLKAVWNEVEKVAVVPYLKVCDINFYPCAL